MIVKICGITSLEDALFCAQAGASFLGYNFYPPSPRFTDKETCAHIVLSIRKDFPHIRHVGVFVNETPETIRSTLATCGLDLAQCSGNETPGMIIKCGSNAFKAIRPASINDLRSALGIYPARKDAPSFLVDAHHPGEFGGTGRQADWTLASWISSRQPIFLAGGLTPENVAEAVRHVHPWGVDVASGVENQPGRKDENKVIAFIHAALSAAEE